MALENFGTIVLLNIPYALELKVCGSVAGCGWTISSNVLCMMIKSFELRYRAAILAPAPDGITLWMMVETTHTPLLFVMGCPCFVFFVKKKCPPDRLHAFGSDKYEVSLWIARIMPLFWYRRTTYGCVEQ